MTVDLFSLFLANVVDIQKEHLLLHTPVLNKTTRLSSARMFVTLYRLLFIHVCMYHWQNQHTLPLVSGWILVPSDHWRWQEKLLCSVVWHYHQSYVQHYITHLMLVQCVIANHVEVLTCQFWRKFYQAMIVTMVQSSVNSRSTLYPIDRRSYWPRRSFKLSSGWLRFVNWTISSWPHKPQKFNSL